MRRKVLMKVQQKGSCKQTALRGQAGPTDSDGREEVMVSTIGGSTRFWYSRRLRTPHGERKATNQEWGLHWESWRPSSLLRQHNNQSIDGISVPNPSMVAIHKCLMAHRGHGCPSDDLSMQSMWLATNENGVTVGNLFILVFGTKAPSSVPRSL